MKGVLGPELYQKKLEAFILTFMLLFFVGSGPAALELISYSRELDGLLLAAYLIHKLMEILVFPKLNKIKKWYSRMVLKITLRKLQTLCLFNLI